MMHVLKSFSFAVAVTMLLAVQPAAQAASLLEMEYTVNPIGSLFDYEFRLTLDTLDPVGGAPGWGWIIFGDGSSSSSPLTDFIGDTGDLPIGPFIGYDFSSGGHNGPTLKFVDSTWYPTSVGDYLQWSGTSTANLPQGDLLFTTLTFNAGNAHVYNLEIANRVTAFGAETIPLPTASLAGVLGFGLIATLRRKRRA